jgi:hypothetical protein
LFRPWELLKLKKGNPVIGTQYSKRANYELSVLLPTATTMLLLWPSVESKADTHFLLITMP